MHKNIPLFAVNVVRTVVPVSIYSFFLFMYEYIWAICEDEWDVTAAMIYYRCHDDRLGILGPTM